MIVVGAGVAAMLIAKEMLKSPSLGYTPIGLVDDDPRKKNLRLHNVRVFGTTDELPKILAENRPDEVLIAIPSASGEVRQRIVDIARGAGIPVKTLPGIYELISGDLDLAGQIRPVQVEDVLGREPVEVDLRAVSSYIADATVLTGAGGRWRTSCRPPASAQAAVLVDQGEGARDRRGSFRARPRRASVLPTSATRPWAVFSALHRLSCSAARNKHVLMEANPLESVRNTPRRRR